VYSTSLQNDIYLSPDAWLDTMYGFYASKECDGFDYQQLIKIWKWHKIH